MAMQDVTGRNIMQAVDDLMAEGPEGARRREQNEFDRIADGRDKIILCGAGGFGRRTLKGLRKAGLEPTAFVDNNPRIWGTKVDGVACFSPSDAATRYGENAVFVMTMWKANALDRVPDREAHLRALGCKAVTSFGPLYWKYPEAFLPYFCVDLPHKVFDQTPAVKAAAKLWADDRSRQEYFEQLRWRLQMNFDMADPALETMYFPEDLFAVGSDEVLVDCGAFDGDSLAPFVAKTQGKFSAIYAFEPDPENFVKLKAAASALPGAERIHVHESCVGGETGTVRFSAFGSDNSVTGVGDTVMQCVRLDDVLDGPTPTIVKMDIEGYEPDALEGLRNTIRHSSVLKHAPILAISAYHIQDHLWKIPLLIHALNPDYKLYLRAHQRDFFDLVCYALP